MNMEIGGKVRAFPRQIFRQTPMVFSLVMRAVNSSVFARMMKKIAITGAVVTLHLPAYAIAVQPNEIPVIAILIDSGQVATEFDRTKLKQFAAGLPFTPKFMVCLLQSTWCSLPVTARDPADRLNHIHDAIDNISKRASKAGGLPRTDDISRVMNVSVNRAFRDFWEELGPVAKQEGDRQVWIVMVSPRIYIDLGTNGSLDRHLHDSRIPEVCFTGRIRLADVHPEARLRVVIAANQPYPDSSVSTFARIFSSGDQRRLQGIYQVVLGCPTRTNNVRNWMERSVPATAESSCEIQPGVIWADSKPESLSCAAATGPVVRPLLDQITSPAAAAQGAPAAASKSGAASGSGDAQTAKPASGDAQPNKAVTGETQSGKVVSDSPPSNSGLSGAESRRPAGDVQKTPDSAVANLGTNAGRPGPSPPAAPVTTSPAAISPPERPGQPSLSPPSGVATVEPARPARPRRPGPDPASVTAVADANPSPVITGTLVRRPLAQNANAGPVTIDFVRVGDGPDAMLGLVGPHPSNVAATTAAINRLVVNAPLRAGSYSIVVTQRPRDQNCTSGRRIRGTVNVTGQAVKPVGIALDLEVSRCEQNTAAVVIGTLVVK